MACARAEVMEDGPEVVLCHMRMEVKPTPKAAKAAYGKPEHLVLESLTEAAASS